LIEFIQNRISLFVFVQHPASLNQNENRMNKHILIVEDHKALRKSLMDWLKGIFPQCDFSEAACGEEAIEICRDILPDLILMDISLPRLNGIGTVKDIISLVPKAKVIMLTIHEEEAYRIEAMSAGASAYVPKSMMKNDLIPTIRRLFAASGHKESKGME
jgi:DNA-binding NarL/FixJ family response regulator